MQDRYEFRVRTIEDLIGHQERLLKDPDFDPTFSQVVDFTRLTKVEIIATDVRLVAKSNIFSSHSRRAVFVKNDLRYGLAGMFEIHRELAGEVGIQVFRNLEEALDRVLSPDTVPGDAPRN